MSGRGRHISWSLITLPCSPTFFLPQNNIPRKNPPSSRFCSLSSSVPTGPVTPSCGSALNRTTGGFAPNQTQDTGADGQRRSDQYAPILFQPNDNFRPTNFLFKDPFPYRMQTCWAMYNCTVTVAKTVSDYSLAIYSISAILVTNNPWIENDQVSLPFDLDDFVKHI